MLQCPVCQKDMAEFEEAKRSIYYPFCGERCKLVDLGKWLDADYIIKSRVAAESPDLGEQGF